MKARWSARYVMLAMAGLVGCAGSDGQQAVTVAPTITTLAPSTTPPTTVSPSSTAPTSVSPTTAAPTTSAPSPSPTTTSPSTTAPCAVFTDTDVQSPGFPGQMSGLYGADVRVGAHPCFERFVLELQGTGTFPGYHVRYEQPPLLDDPRGEPVDVAGAAFIVVTVESWMTTMEGAGYRGPTRITPTTVTHIRELVMLGNFEGVTTWAVGVDRQRPLMVSTLADPPRLVVDIAT